MNSRRLALAAALMAAAAILSATLVPDRSITAEALARASRGPWSLADLVRNVILFAPLGLALAWSGISPRRAIFAGALLSALIELSSRFRAATPTSDFAANVAGVALALALFRTAPVWLAPTPLRAGALEAGAAAVLGLVGTRVLLAPAPTAAIFYGHRTPLLAARIGLIAAMPLAVCLGPLGRPSPGGRAVGGSRTLGDVARVLAGTARWIGRCSKAPPRAPRRAAMPRGERYVVYSALIRT